MDNIHFIRALYMNCTSKLDKNIIGDFEQVHPLVKKMLDECAPRPGVKNKRYEEFVFCYLQVAREELKVPPEELRKYEDIIRHNVPEAKFYELMSSFAVGMQFAARKVGGSVNANKFEFAHTLYVDKDENKNFKNFLAAAMSNKGEIRINPAMVCQLLLQEEKSPQPFTAKETLILAGAEEMLHIFQYQNGQRSAGYDLANFKQEDYENDPLEKEAGLLHDVAVRELGLGGHNPPPVQIHR